MLYLSSIRNAYLTDSSSYFSYSGHGTKIRDDDWGEEDDGFDEALVPVDFKSAGVIRDDDLYEILIANLPDGVHMVSLMDCCHSGTILDLPYIFKGDGSTGTEVSWNVVYLMPWTQLFYLDAGSHCGFCELLTTDETRRFH